MSTNRKDKKSSDQRSRTSHSGLFISLCHCRVESKKGRIRRVKYWEIIADNLSKAGWSWGCLSAIDSNGRTIWIVDAHPATLSVTLCVRMKS